MGPGGNNIMSAGGALDQTSVWLTVAPAVRMKKNVATMLGANSRTVKIHVMSFIMLDA